MKLPQIVRRLFRSIVTIKRSFGEHFIYHGKFLLLSTLKSIYHVCETAIPIISFAGMAVVVNDVGFNPFIKHSAFTFIMLKWCLMALKVLLMARFLSEWYETRKVMAHVYSLILVLLAFFLHSLLLEVWETPPLRTNNFVWKKVVLYIGIIFLFITEISKVLRFIYRKSLNASFLFVASFAFLILGGGLLLMLPNATVNGITPVDALFTSASAVCVTGLVVVDTATTFTTMGKVILLGLIQIGGLGIMTFATLLSYLAAGSVSFQSQLALKDMLNSSKMNNVIQVVQRIIIVTFFFEFIGALLIHWSIGETITGDQLDKIFFSVFHAVSGFCNAGFSTLSAGLYDEQLRFNYPLHVIIAVLVILGGMGFPIVFNLFTLIRIRATNTYKQLFKIPGQESFIRILKVNSRLAFVSSGILLVIGFVAYLTFEHDNTLRQHPSIIGKLVTAFFGSVTPRSSGFNTVDMASMGLPMIMVYLLLMWIGASPGGTGGGIKTTTASVALLNLVSIVRGKDRTEVFRTQISELSINKAFAIMILSLLVIGVGVLLIAVKDEEQSLLRISFEVFSAYSTVGLSLGLTPELSVTSKLVLIIVMFIGRVGALTVLVAFVQQVKPLYYRYPTEDIMF